MSGHRYVTNLECAKEKACQFGVAPKCLGDGCMAWTPGHAFRSDVTGEPDPVEEHKGLARFLFGRVKRQSGITFAPMVYSVEHGFCGRKE